MKPEKSVCIAHGTVTKTTAAAHKQLKLLSAMTDRTISNIIAELVAAEYSRVFSEKTYER